ncbi:MAG: hypothetical protein WC151_12070 [Bacteroidales bacterium]
MDPLEKFVVENREAFNVAKPPKEVWENLDSQISALKIKSRHNLILRWTATAAAAVLIFASAWFLNDLRDRRLHQSGIKQPQAIAMIDELQEAEAFYEARINQSKTRLASYSTQHPELLEEINNDLEQLSLVYEELKNDLDDHAANQEIIEAMIQNYRLRLGILEQILAQLIEKNETQAIQSNHYEI